MLESIKISRMVIRWFATDCMAACQQVKITLKRNKMLMVISKHYVLLIQLTISFKAFQEKVHI